MGFFTMFLVSLAFMVIGELLRPKPKFDNPKPSALGDFQFPTADASRVIPIFAGKCKFNGPNTTYFGDLQIKAIKKKVKTGLFSSTTIIQGYKYFLTVQLTWAWGYVDEFVRFEADDKIIKIENMVTTADYFAFDMNDPGHMSDDDPKNGLKGHVVLYRGSTTQPYNAKLKSLWGEDQTQPFAMLSYMVLEHCYLGNSDTPPKLSLVMGRYPNTLGVTGGKHTYNDGDANPACWCYEILTNRIWGRKLDPAKIDIDSFIACAETLHGEGTGIAMMVDNSMSVRELLAEILRHVDGVIFPDPATGLYTMALARNDYDIDDLLELNDDDIPDEDFEFSRQSWEETKNLIIVNYTDRNANFQVRPAQYKDLANINARFGQIDPETIDFLGYSNSATARSAAERAGKTRSAPVVRTQFTGNRKAYDFRPATVFKLSKERYGIHGLVMRVIDINYGTLDDPRIRITATEDIFHVNASAYELTPPSDWVSPVSEIEPVDEQALFEIPYHLMGVEERRIGTVATPTSLSDIGYETWQDPAGGTAFAYGQQVPVFTPSGVLVDAYDADTDPVDLVGFLVTPEYETDELSSVTDDELYAGVNMALIKSTAGEEWVSWKTVATEGDNLRISTVIRGALDTIALDHPAGGRVWFVSEGVGQLRDTPYSADTSVNAKLLPYNIGGTLDIGDATAIAKTPTSRAWKPYPAANIQVNGSDSLAVVPGDASITWAIRHRVAQYTNTRIVAQDEPSYVDTPEGGYTLKVYIGGVLKRTVIVASDPYDSFTYTPLMRLADQPADLIADVEVGVIATNGAYSSIERKSQPFYMSAANHVLITTEVAPTALKDLPYSMTVNTVNGIPAYTWSITAGALPTGLSLDTSTGIISGTPTVEGPFNFTIRATDTVGDYDEQSYTVNVFAAAGDPYFGYVSALLHGNGNLNDTTGKVWTSTGGAAASSAQLKFGSGSLYFDGSNDYLTTPAHADFDFGTGDFTIESWVRPAGLAANGEIIAHRNGADTNNFWYIRLLTTGFIRVVSKTAGSVFYDVTTTSNALTVGTWKHVAVVRSAGVITVYVDGVACTLSVTSTGANAWAYPSAYPVVMGAGDLTSSYVNAYLDEVRITKGLARYTTGFSPPATQFGDFIGGFAAGQLAAHLHLDGANGSTVFTDRSGKTWTAQAQAQISTAQSVFGGASLLLDGAGDAITTPNHADFNFGTGDFTVAMRGRFSVVTGVYQVLASTYGGTTTGWSFEVDPAGKLFFACAGDGATASGTTVLSANTWYDIVVARRGNKLRIFLNGALEAEVTDTTNISSSGLCAVGALFYGSYLASVNGYLDEVMMVKGIALWDRAHTTPTSAFADV